NTSKPDQSWSGWQKPTRTDKLGDGGLARVASPEGRYVQFRLSLGAAATVRDAQIYYLAQNQRPRLTEIQAGEEPKPGAASLPAAMTPKARSPVVKLRWKVENPDGDELCYRLWFREESE